MGYIPKSSTPEVMMSALQLVLFGMLVPESQLAWKMVPLPYVEERRHEVLQEFMLVNDSATVAVEVPPVNVSPMSKNTTGARILERPRPTSS